MNRTVGLPIADKPRAGFAPPSDSVYTVATGIAAVLLVAGGLLGLPRPVELILVAVGLAAGGWKATREALPRTFRGHLDIDLLMIVAAVAAVALGHFGEAIILLFLFSLANRIEEIAEEKSKTAIARLLKDRPTHAMLVREGNVSHVPIGEIRPGDTVRLNPGEMASVDGTVVFGESAVDESSLTGESTPLLKRVGDTIIAGTINTTGSLDMVADQPAAKSTLERIVKCAEEAQERKSEFQSTVERLENRYAAAILVLVATVIGLQWLFGVEIGTAFYRGIVLLVVASPCALVLSTPAAVLAAIATAARLGVILKGGSALEELSRIDAVVFDKTGTLTKGMPTLTDIVVSPFAPQGFGESDLIAYAASLEAHSEHVLAREIMRVAEERNIPISPAASFETELGLGIHANLEGERVWLGNARLFGTHGTVPPAWIEEAKQELETQGKTVIIVQRCQDNVEASDDYEWLGLLAFRDELRDDAVTAIGRLREAGIERIIMLTGDNKFAAAAVGKQLEIDEFHAELLPEQKTEWVDRLEKTHGRVLMVGDGVNDVPALARATVACAMGNAGIDVALKHADCVLSSDNLTPLASAVALSQRAGSIAKQNLVLAAGAMVFLSCGQLFWDIPLAIGVLGHEGSTVLVCLNGLRLLRLPNLAGTGS